MAYPRKAPTMNQVAVLAGVSQQTVSRYLRDERSVTPATGRRVAAAVAKLGYSPNLAARIMRTRRTGTIAIVLPGWTGVAEQSVAAACDEATRRGYRVEVLIGMDETPEALRRRAEEALTSGAVEGVLALSPLAPPRRNIGPVVEMHVYDPHLRADAAAADDFETARALVAQLAAMGHRDLLHVAGPREWTTARARRDGYLAAVSELSLRSHGEIEGPWLPDSGVLAVRDLPLDSPVTAVVACNDAVAAGVLRGAHERGWSVPGRLSVTGWGDRRLTRYTVPSLTTVVVDRESAGRHALERLVAAIREEDEPTAPSGPLTRIELRESTGPAPHDAGRD
ncbi:LacI family DNA-binding transcriptional regulator [Occultella aeris]|uniref:Catabolite control protein A n=1 Tax=Occultella aeris TaxID=2761496 RepID=A0A7M4DPH7_9MICO|nr:LacI family DNA-binding transcriptional regulator [Occultella aeris]VZO39371.1 Catabolite control protein A [Occultella aeris]